MKLLITIALLTLPALVWAEEEEEGCGEEGCSEQEASKPEPMPPPDPAQLLADLEAAVEAKDAAKIGALLPGITEVGRTSKAEAEIDGFASLLLKGLALAKDADDHDLQRKVIDCLGELRSKKSAGALKRLAFAKKTKDEKEEELKARAILAVSTLRDVGLSDDIAEEMKDRSVVVAKAACEALRHYDTAKGSLRLKVAELVMKRLDAEYPAAGQSGKVSEEQRKRWNELSPAMLATMQAICRQPTIVEIENWREWWKENKKSPKAWKDGTP